MKKPFIDVRGPNDHVEARPRATSAPSTSHADSTARPFRKRAQRYKADVHKVTHNGSKYTVDLYNSKSSIYELVEVHTFRRGESACKLRQREKFYYYDARQTQYNRFGPHIYNSPPVIPVKASEEIY